MASVFFLNTKIDLIQTFLNLYSLIQNHTHIFIMLAAVSATHQMQTGFAQSNFSKNINSLNYCGGGGGCPPGGGGGGGGRWPSPGFAAPGGGR